MWHWPIYRVCNTAEGCRFCTCSGAAVLFQHPVAWNCEKIGESSFKFPQCDSRWRQHLNHDEKYYKIVQATFPKNVHVAVTHGQFPICFLLVPISFLVTHCNIVKFVYNGQKLCSVVQFLAIECTRTLKITKVSTTHRI